MKLFNYEKYKNWVLKDYEQMGLKVVNDELFNKRLKRQYKWRNIAQVIVIIIIILVIINNIF